MKNLTDLERIEKIIDHHLEKLESKKFYKVKSIKLNWVPFGDIETDSFEVKPELEIKFYK